MVDQIISCFELVKIKVPEFTDYFGKKAVIELNLGDTSSFLMFDKSVNLIKLSDEGTISEHTGSYKIKYKLTDSLGSSLDYSFKVIVTCF